MLKKDEAVCIRTFDYSETSQVVTFLTRDTGKISTIAKGSKRPKSLFGGPIEVFSSGTIVFAEPRSDKLATLTEFEQSRLFSGLRTKLSSLNSAFFAAELVNSLTAERDPNGKLYDRFVQFLSDVADAPKKSESLALLILFQLSLLDEIGSRPVLNNCVNCKQPFTAHLKEIYFSSSANGLICKDCHASFADKRKLSTDAAACLINFHLIVEADEKILQEIENTLIFHFTAILHHPLKMAKYVLTK